MDACELTSLQLATLLGSTKEEIEHAIHLTKIPKLEYRVLTESEHTAVYDEIEHSIKNLTDERRAGTHRIQDWEQGWTELFEKFQQSNYDVSTLAPQYFKKRVIVRLDNRFVEPLTDNFMLHVMHVLRAWLLPKYLGNATSIYEFGCGSAHHLAFLANLFPTKYFFGFDWAVASQRIIQSLFEQHGMNIFGARLNLFQPRESLPLLPNSGVFTFGALEQLGPDFTDFLNYLINSKCAVCVNVEPLYELYDQADPMEAQALRYHQGRNYLGSFIQALKDLETSGRVEILKIHHVKAGNKFNDTSSYIAWKVR